MAENLPRPEVDLGQIKQKLADALRQAGHTMTPADLTMSAFEIGEAVEDGQDADELITALITSLG